VSSVSNEFHPDLQRWIERQRAAPESRAFAPLAAAYRELGELSTAIRVLEEGMARHPNYVSGLVLLAECQRDLGDDEAAEASFARVLELDPDNLVALRYRADRAHRRGALDRAVDALRRAMEIDPFDRDVQADLGLVTAALDRQSREASRRDVPPAFAAPMPAPPPLEPPPPAWGDAGPPGDVWSPADGAAAVDAAPPPEPPWAPEPPEPAAPWAEPRFDAPAPVAPWAASAPPPAVAPPPTWMPPPSAPIPARPPAVPPPAAPVAPPAWLEPPPVREPAEAAPGDPFAFEPRPPAPTEPTYGARGGATGSPGFAAADAPVQPPAIDLRRVGQTPAEPSPEPPAEGRPPWGFSRQDDRIVVAPADTGPVRGPIRSVEDRLFAEQRGLPAWPDEMLPAESAPAPPVPPAEPPLASGEFATLTLAGIYESQGYLHKALAIYDELQRKHPHDTAIRTRLAALQLRLAGVAPAPVVPAPAAAPPPARTAQQPPVEDSGVAWRLLDSTTLGDPAETATRLRQATAEARTREQSRQHTVRHAPVTGPAVQPTPPAPPPAPAAPPPPPAAPEPGRGHEDYERFLQYLRSLKP
jgi:hypothetical protein